MTLFCAVVRRDLVSLKRFLLLSHVQVFSCKISSVYRLKYTYSCFSPHFCFLVVVLLIIMTSVKFLVAVSSLSLLFFLCSLRFLLLMHPHHFQYWRVLVLLLFLTYIVCLYHLSDVRLYTSSLISNVSKNPSPGFYLVGRVFANDLGDRSSIPGRVIPKT